MRPRLFFTNVIAIVSGIMVLVLLTRWYGRAAENRMKLEAMEHARKILLCLTEYSNEASGFSPGDDESGPKSSNDAFRLLFVGGMADDESIFGSPRSKLGKPDGKIGGKHNKFADALQPGENHWALVKGISSSQGMFPLIFENPVNTSWPPKWDVDLAGTDAPGRPWSDRTVIVGFTDGSVRAHPLGPAQNGKACLDYIPGITEIYPKQTGPFPAWDEVGAHGPKVLNVEK